MSESLKIAGAEARKGLRLGFGGIWMVPRHAILRDGLIYPGRVRGRAYLPAAYPEIASEFAKLAGADDEMIVRFVRRWGHLGYSRLTATLGPKWRAADPVPWIRAHAVGVKTCFELLEHLDPYSERHTELAGYLDGLEAATPRGQRIKRSLNSGIRDKIVWVRAIPGETELIQARGLVKHLVNDNISAISMRIDDGSLVKKLVSDNDSPPDRGFEIRYEFTALIEMVWWHVGKVARDRFRITRCIECGSPFEQKDLRQKYCPPPRGSNESICGRSYRMRTQRRRSTRAL